MQLCSKIGLIMGFWLKHSLCSKMHWTSWPYSATKTATIRNENQIWSWNSEPSRKTAKEAIICTVTKNWILLRLSNLSSEFKWLWIYLRISSQDLKSLSLAQPLYLTTKCQCHKKSVLLKDATPSCSRHPKTATVDLRWMIFKSRPTRCRPLLTSALHRISHQSSKLSQVTTLKCCRKKEKTKQRISWSTRSN